MVCLRPNFLIQKNKLLGLILLVTSLSSVIFWFTKYPDIRFGISSILVFFISLFLLFNVNYNFSSNIKKKINIFTIILLLFFNAKNIQRIYSEFNRTDRYAFTDFPYPPINKNLYKTENLIYSKTVNHMIENQEFTNVFWINVITNK
jgi:hypothetical protein